ncbi:MAG: hypothetical protein ACTS6H_02885, partial [Candidatus Hodgkinia cicadicola]
TYHNGLAVDLAIISIWLTCASLMLNSINFVTTILCLREAKLKLTEMPLLAWGLLISSMLKQSWVSSAVMVVKHCSQISI